MKTARSPLVMASPLSPPTLIAKIEAILCSIGEPFVRRIEHEQGYRIEINYAASRRKPRLKSLDPRASLLTRAQPSSVPPQGKHVPEPTQQQGGRDVFRLNACLLELETRGISRHRIEAILNSCEPRFKGQLLVYAALMRDVQHLLREERDWRTKLLHHVERVEYPPLPADLKHAVLVDCRKAIALIERAIQKFAQAQHVLAPARARVLRKGRWLSHARSELSRLMEPAIRSSRVSRNRAAHLTFELLKAWAPEEAPTTAASVRTGSYSRNRRNTSRTSRRPTGI